MFLKAEIGELESLDPAMPYDTRSWEVIANVYDNLLAYSRLRREFIPRLATTVPTAENGLLSEDGKRYIFPIRADVCFHDGTQLQPADIVYSLRRLLVHDHPRGPAWMLLEPLLGVGQARNSDGDLQITFRDLEESIYEDGEAVILRLARPFAPLLAILATPPTSIVSESWAVSHGEWPNSADTIDQFNQRALTSSYLHEHMNGTGPYRLVSWEPESSVELIKHEDYWGEVGSIDRVKILKENEWSRRRDLIVSGEADMVQVDRTFVPEIEDHPDITIYDDLPLPVCDTISFNFSVEGVESIGSGALDGEGIPPDFFADIEVRRGFQYAFNWEKLIKEIYLGKAIQLRGPIPSLIMGSNPHSPVYSYDPYLSAQHFRRAWNGRLWKVGFKVTLFYNAGNFLRESWARILSEELISINSKFSLVLKDIDLSEYRRLLAERKLALFTAGWLVDYPDPHNFVKPLMSKTGLWARWQGYSNSEAEELIKAGLETSDPIERERIYGRLQEIAYEDAKEIYTVEPLGQAALRSAVRGWQYDLITGPQAVTLFAELSKA